MPSTILNAWSLSTKKKTEAVHDRNNQERMEDINHSMVLAELLAYIDESRKDDDIRVFKLADLCKLYSTRLQQLGMERYDHVHSTHLKNRILAHFPDLAAHKEGYDVLLAFNKDLGAALRVSLDQNHDDEAICLARAANIVRKDMLKWQA